MGIVIGLIVVAFVIFVVSKMFGGEGSFADATSMSNQHLMAAIAGQADSLEKISAAPIESQKSPFVIRRAKWRREYIAYLCMETISRADRDDGPKYPGATRSISPFAEAAEYAKELEAKGVGKANAAVRAVKEKMFIPHAGVNYPTRWEI